MTTARLPLLAFGLVVLALAPSDRSFAGVGNDQDQGSEDNAGIDESNTDAPTGLLTVFAASGGSSHASSAASGSAPAGPRCSWTVADASVWPDPRWSDQSSGAISRDQHTRLPSPGGGAGTETLYLVDCAGGAGFRWAAPADYIDPQIVIDAAYDSATAQIPQPTLDINPTPQAGGIVNIGLWLAVADPGQVNALASIGPVWASVTARFTGVTWDMGNGDTVSCDGLGTPYIAGSDTDRQGPCGYTFTHASLASAPYQMSASGHWDIQLATSTGRNEPLGPIDITTTFDYDVDEIQTIGQG